MKKEKFKEWVPVLILTGIMFFIFYPILTGGAYLATGVSQNDQWLFNFPLKEFYRSQLIDGKLPLWTNLIGNGYPLFAEGQVGAIYPLHLILFYFLPTILAYNFNIVLHFVMAGIFTYLYTRNIGLSRKSSFLSSLVFSLSGFMTIHIHQININMVITYLPLALYASDKIISGKRKAFFLLTITFVLQILAGHIEMFYYCLGITGVYFLLRLNIFSESRDLLKRAGFQSIVFFALSLVLSFGITFIQIAGTYELNSLSQRSEGLSIEHASATLWPLKTLGMFVNPKLYDLYRVEKEYTPTGDTVNVQALYGYIGILPLLLAIGAVLFNKKKIAILFAVLLVLAFLYGLGRSTQLFSIFWNLIPGLKFFRFPTKILFFIEFCLAILSGIGLDTLITRLKIKHRGVLKFSYIVIVLSLIDLMYFNAFATRKIVDAKKWLAKPDSAGFLSEKIGNPYSGRVYLHGMSNIDYSYAINERYQMVFRNMLPIDFNMIYKIPSNQEWAVLFLERQTKLNSEKTKIDFGKNRISLTETHKKALALQAVKYIISDVEISDPDLVPVWNLSFPSEVGHVFYVANPSGGTEKQQLPVSKVNIYENRYYYPRIYFTNEIVVSRSPEESLETILGSGFDPLAKTVVEIQDPKNPEEYKVWENEFIHIDNDKESSVSIIIDKHDYLELQVNANSSGILVLSDTYYPGWRVWVDDREERVLRANYTFRGVFLKEGVHRIKMKYEPTYWKFGKTVSLATLAVFLTAHIVSLIMERKKREQK